MSIVELIKVIWFQLKIRYQYARRIILDTHLNDVDLMSLVYTDWALVSFLVFACTVYVILNDWIKARRFKITSIIQ